MAAAMALPPGMERDQMLRYMQYSILQAEPEVALEYLRQRPAEEFGPGLKTIVGALAQKDAAAALAFVQEQDPKGKAGALSTAVYQWGQRDPQAAAEYALKHGDVFKGAWQQTLSGAVNQWAGSDFAQATRWVEAIRDPAVRGPLLGVLTSSLSNTDPGGAAVMLERVPREARGDMALEIASRWVEIDAEAAKAWALKLPEGSDREGAVIAIARSYADISPAAGAAYLEQLPPGKSRDRGVESFVYGMARKDVQGACEWAMTIGDPSMRAKMVEYAGEAWLMEDRVAALQWIRSNTALGPAERAVLLKKVEETRE
jgi:hypothetical protein